MNNNNTPNSNYDDYIDHSMVSTLNRHAAVKKAIMEYPHYTEKQRNAWMDAIDESLNVILQSRKNARDILNSIFEQEQANNNKKAL